MNEKYIIKENSSPYGQGNPWSDNSGCFTSINSDIRSFGTQKTVIAFDHQAIQNFMNNYISTKWVDALKIQMLERKMLLLEEQIKQSQNSKPKVVVINTMLPEPMSVKKPIYITITNIDDSYLAEFFDANISASGETPDEAVSNIKNIICAKYMLFKKHKFEELGKKIKQQYLVLCHYIEGVN